MSSTSHSIRVIHNCPFSSYYFCDSLLPLLQFSKIPLKTECRTWILLPAPLYAQGKLLLFLKINYLLAPAYRIAIKLLALKVSKTCLFLKVCTFGTQDYLSAERWGFEHPPPSYPHCCVLYQGPLEVRGWWVKQEDQSKTSFLQFHREISWVSTFRSFHSIEMTWILTYLCTKGLCDCKVLSVSRRQKFCQPY